MGIETREPPRGGGPASGVVSIVVSIDPGNVRHSEMLSRQIARAVNELAFLCRTSGRAKIA